MQRYNLLRLKIVFYVATMGCLFCNGLPGRAQAPSPPPQKVWVLLGYSTLDSTPPNWNWLKLQCAKGNILKTLQPVIGRVGGIIIPVFDDGTCFYSTAVEPFAGRNPESMPHEQAVQELIEAARQKHIPVFLGIDALGWRKIGKVKSESSLFTKVPTQREIARTTDFETDATEHYASPFNSDVRSAMTKLVGEIALKFPKAAGIAVDLRLSRRSILGYSEAAREASILENGFDPFDVVTQTKIENQEEFEKWVAWRRNGLTTLLKALVSSYAKGGGNKVLLSGHASFYDTTSIENLRSAQDWMTWVENGLADGILLEGQWLSSYSDNWRVKDYYTRVNEAAKKLGKPVFLLPTTGGDYLVKESNYLRDWTSFGNLNPNQTAIAAIAWNNQDVEQIAALATGSRKLKPLAKPKISEVSPQWSLPDSSGTWHAAKEWRGQSSLLMLSGEMSPRYIAAARSLSEFAAQLRQNKIEPIVISSVALPIKLDNNVRNLIDAGHEFSWSGNIPGLLLVDKAGFTRRIELIGNNANTIKLLHSLTNPLSEIEEGKLAPDFVVQDMNGQTVRLKDFHGKKNLLLTFFPQCLSGG
jgi:hypothetical protein